MHVCIYIRNKYTQHTHTRTQNLYLFIIILDVINHKLNIYIYSAVKRS